MTETKSYTVRADEVRPGDVAALPLVGYVVTVDTAEPVDYFRTTRTLLRWKEQGMIPAGRLLLPHAEPVVVER